MKFLTFLTLTFMVTMATFAQTLERKDVPLKYQWNLADLYGSVEQWRQDKAEIQKGIDEIAAYKGRLGESAGTFYKAMSTYFDVLKKYYKYSEYATRLSDENLKIGANQALSQEASALGTQFSEKTSFIRPEILNINSDKLKNFFNEEKKLADYRMFVDNIERLKSHTLSEGEERILASFNLPGETPSIVYNIFNNAEMPNPKVTLSTNETVELSAPAFTQYRTSEVRSDREKVFSTFFTGYSKFQNTIGSNLAGKVKNDYVYSKSRNYATTLEYGLSGANIPVSVYENLISQIHNNLPTLYRFLDLKKRMLNLDTLHYYDLYTPIVKEVKMPFTIEEGQKVILEALKPMGEEYLKTLQKAFDSRWIDYMPTAGKMSGAYSSGAAYDIHPYILTNWTGDYESVSTLAHELGHTMHSYFSNKSQPFSNSDYATFVAEIASTFNENLLNNYMVSRAKTKEEKLYLLGSYLELLRTTIFRQVLFAEFEWDIHKAVENGQSLTGEAMSDMYYKLVKQYYGNNEGKCVVDPYIAYEWAYIPHFINYTYYVFQYSTSLIYSTALAQKVIAEGKPAVDKYYNILKGGSSDYPIELIKKAGIDPLSSQPFELAMKRMNDVMDQIEALLNEK
ncbi:MAG: oligoendopeptidase F [Ignavibacteria bacterium]|nr:oligoendopeptidase F [Ignavibacteria bacterium]MCU7505201.1 oligoendopeptidase F [Ignavibacteria bacterium]MCU7518104.1 oligoendopeptidase F [Ignavibacteria bacterium]